MGPGPTDDLSDLQHADRSRRPRSTAAAGTPAAPPPTTRSTAARPGSTAPSRRSTSADVAHTGSFASSKASRTSRRSCDVDGVKIGFVSYTDATNGIPAPHSWSVNEYAGRRSEGGREGDHPRRPRGPRRGRRGGDRPASTGATRTPSSPNSSQLAVAKKLTDAKVITVVVGQGPHVVQPIERINGKFVVFSEGNLVSNQGAASGLPAATQDGLIALLALQGGRRRVDRAPGHLRADLGPARRLRRAAGEAVRPPRSCASPTTAPSTSSARARASAPSTEGPLPTVMLAAGER